MAQKKKRKASRINYHKEYNKLFRDKKGYTGSIICLVTVLPSISILIYGRLPQVHCELSIFQCASGKLMIGPDIKLWPMSWEVRGGQPSAVPANWTSL